MVLPGTHPLVVTHATARLMIRAFDLTGLSNHSERANTLWVILSWCQYNKVPYVLEAWPGRGYSVRKLLPIEINTERPT